MLKLPGGLLEAYWAAWGLLDPFGNFPDLKSCPRLSLSLDPPWLSLEPIKIFLDFLEFLGAFRGGIPAVYSPYTRRTPVGHPPYTRRVLAAV